MQEKTGGFTSHAVEDRILLKKKPWNCFGFSLYPWKFQVKQNSTPGNLTKLYMLNPLKISRPKTKNFKKLHPWKFGKIGYVTSFGNFKAKPKTHGNSTWIFLGLPWIFHVVFNQLLEILHAISWIALEILFPNHLPPCFFQNSPISKTLY